MRALVIGLTVLALAPPAHGTVLFRDGFDRFQGNGLAPGGGGGRLDSTRWAATGLSEGDAAHGSLRDGGDFARGESAGGVSRGGLYAFDPGAGGPALGWQATGADLTPGSLVLRVPVPAGLGPGPLTLDFLLWWRNDGGRATRIAVSAGAPGRQRAQPALGAVTPAAAGAGEWRRVVRSAALVGFDPPVSDPRAADELLVHWEFDDAGGSGGRDEVAIDDVVLRSSGAASPAPTPASTLALAALGVAAAAARRRGASVRRPRMARSPSW